MIDVRNRLLASLPAPSLARLAPFLERVTLPLRTPLVEPNVPTPHVVFLEAGLASVVASTPNGSEQIEIGHLGFEGMSGLHVVLGVDQTPTHTFMQVAGSGLRLPADRLVAAMAEDGALRDQLLRYVQTYQVQLAHSALANGRYTIPQRLARWLLMCHDRLQADELPLTHDLLALMLGVRRAGVTNEMHVLEGESAIKATRAMVRVVDRKKLIALADGSYGVPEAEYVRLIEGQSSRSPLPAV